MTSNKQHLLSLIIPAYRQEKYIYEDLRRIQDVLNQIRYDYEIVVVIDGIHDKTYTNAKKLHSKKIKVLGYDTNHGKGYAIRYGMKQAKGDIIAFIDSGMDINPNGLSMLLEHFEWYNADIVVGSKMHPVSKVAYPLKRQILSFGYRILVKILFNLQIRDTQVGIKIFRRKVLEDILPRLLVKQYAFDVEMLAVARHLGYKRIYEAPIELDFKPESSILSKHFLHTIYSMFIDTLAVFYRLKILHYYDKVRKSQSSIKKV